MQSIQKFEPDSSGLSQAIATAYLKQETELLMDILVSPSPKASDTDKERCIMNTFTKFVAIAALLASSSTIALAQEDAAAEQDAGVSGATGSEMPTEPPGVDAADDPHAEAAGVAEIDYEAIASSLKTSSVTATDIEAADAETEIQVVLLSELAVQAGGDQSAVDEALTSLEASIEELRTAITDNVEVSAALGAQGYAAEDVVGVTTLQEGGLALVVDDAQ